ncbi:hypothetical protein ACHAW5_002038 [Stephanodiscus triporus]|uniref:Uncharacterized protein n=1 Tax=Stephanodiscus triporus TaxID=2934178 RepID=A0ABD3QLB8_9STRA
MSAEVVAARGAAGREGGGGGSKDEEEEEDWDLEEDDDDIFNEDNDDDPTAVVVVDNDDDDDYDDAAGGDDDDGRPRSAAGRRPDRQQLPPTLIPGGPPPPSSSSSRRPPPPPPPPPTAAAKDDDDDDDDGGSGFHSDVDADVDADGGGGWSDDDYVDDDDDDDDVEVDGPAPSSSSAVPVPAPPPPPPPPRFTTMMTTSATTSPPVAHRTRSRGGPIPDARTGTRTRPRPPPSSYDEKNDDDHYDHDDDDDDNDKSETITPEQRMIHRALSAYVASLRDSDLISRLHRRLRDSSSSADAAAADLRAYYASRPGLRKYTLGVELDRMDYELVLRDGTVVRDDVDAVREHFGAGEDGERRRKGGIGKGTKAEEEEEGGAVTTEEVLVRSANQSLLADMLVALTCPEEDFLSREDDGEGAEGVEEEDVVVRGTGLVLSGPVLCMTSLAETCKFRIDLRCGVVEALCSLAVSVPCHHRGADDDDEVYNNGTDDDASGGRLVLARSVVSVRFRPGGDVVDDEPTVQYAVRSVTPLHAPDSASLRNAAVSLSRDQRLDDHAPILRDGTTSFDVVDDDDDDDDARDRYLLSRSLADSGMLVVSDQIDRLRGAARAKTTGFRSALRQLDGVTNVSSKLQGLGRFGLALPSAEEIEAAEREAAADVRYPPPPPLSAEFRFPRPADVVGNDPSIMLNVKSSQQKFSPPPPPPPPPPPLPPRFPPPPIPQQTETSSRPRPLIGGLLMSGLSRLAAAATNPDEPMAGRSGREDECVRTRSTPPTSSLHSSDDSRAPPTFYRREEHELHADDKQRGYTGHTQIAARQPPRQHTNPSLRTVVDEAGHDDMLDGENDGPTDDREEDAGWSDDEFDFEDGGDDDEQGEGKLEIAKKGTTGPPAEVILLMYYSLHPPPRPTIDHP